MQRNRVMVIGAGIGGLTTALLLAGRGFDVTLVEKEAAAGGKVRRVPVGDTAVDGGPTVFTLRPVFDAIFAEVGERLDDHVRLTRPAVLARHAWSTDERLDLYPDPAQSEAAIGDFAGAAAASGFRDFAAAAARVYRILEDSFLENSRCYPPELMRRIGLWRIGDLIAIRPYESLWKVLGEYFADPRLRQLFGRYTTYCGSSPFKAPATLMLIAHAEARGVWLIDGGMSALAGALEGVARRLGVRFRYDAAVVDILTDRGRASGVTLASGERLDADWLVCNADPQALATGRLGAAGTRAVRAYPAKRRSLSAFTWLLSGRAEGLPLATHNVFFSRDYPAEFADLAKGRVPADPSVYLCALDRGADGAAGAPHERFQIIVNAPADGDRHSYTSEEIERCSRQMRARLSHCGIELVPDTPPAVVTPTDFEALFPSTGGALYGRASHGWAASFLRQSARTRIPGLYCTGGSTHPGAGVPMAALSGRLAAATLMQDRLSTVRSVRGAMPGGMSTRSPTTAASG
ncbi:MAG: phytoene desaturase family protein [Sphingomonadaceae bacterium]|nr:phytoene desaturase family protein [Sphingomonadaceae bacterium]